MNVVDRMAQLMIRLPDGTVFDECRALVFRYNENNGQYVPVGKSGVYSTIRVLCRPPGSTGVYRIFGWLESSEMVTLDILLHANIVYRVDDSNPTWHQLQIDPRTAFVLGMSSESDGVKFSNVVRNTLKYLQDNPVPLSLVPAVSEGIPAGPPPTPKAAWGMYPSIPMKTAPMPAAPKTKAPMTNPPRTSGFMLDSMPASRLAPDGSTIMYARRSQRRDQEACMAYGLDSQTTEKMETEQLLEGRVLGQERVLQEQLRQKEQQETSLREQLRQKEGQEIILRERLRQKEQQEINLQERLRQKEQQEINLQERLRQKEQQETSFQEQLRQKEQQETRSQEQLRQKEQQETRLQERLRQKDQQETTFQERLRQKDQQETRLRERLRQKEQQETRFQERLRQKEQQETSLQGQLRGRDNELQELRVTLSTTQQALDEQRRRELRDWVIDQDEINLTEKCLGVGGWARVVEGTFRGYKVAVKQIHELILSSHNRGLFEREMNMASRCRHPCLLQFIGATNDDPSPMFVTELMETSLRALLQPGPLPETEIFTISLDVAQALNYLHLNRPSPIIHRDISSANVLLWRQGDQWRGKVSDYGTANFLRETMTIAPGAPIYCAPEALTSSQTIKVDVYSFGVLLCEMCIGEMPDPERRDEQISRVQNRLLRGLIRRCVHTEPGTRPTMENIIGELEQHSASS